MSSSSSSVSGSSDLASPVLLFSVSSNLDEYSEWVNSAFWSCLLKEDVMTGERSLFAVKNSKRGNDIYCYRLKRKVSDVVYSMPEESFFNYRERVVGQKTRALFVTLTWDSKICSLEDAWSIRLSKDWNSFLTGLKQKFGRVSTVRVFEAFKNGFPHLHCILLFHDFEFSVFRHGSVFRVLEKERIASGWHSFVDVSAVSSLRSGLKYLSKYLTKSVDGSDPSLHSLLTLSLLWHFRKRAFCISGDFSKNYTDLIRVLSNSKVASFVDGVFCVVDRPASRFKWSFVGAIPPELCCWSESFHLLECEDLDSVLVGMLVSDPFVEKGENLVNWVSFDRGLDEFGDGDFDE